MTSARIVYRPREDATAEGERNALSSVYCFILLKSCAGKKGGPAITAPDDDAKEAKNDCATTEHYT